MSIYYGNIKVSGGNGVDKSVLSNYASISGDNVFTGITQINNLSIDNTSEDPESLDFVMINNDGILSKVPYELVNQIIQNYVTNNYSGGTMTDLNSNQNFYGQAQKLSVMKTNLVLSNYIKYNGTEATIQFPKNMHFKFYNGVSCHVSLNDSWSKPESTLVNSSTLTSEPFEINLNANTPIYLYGDNASSLTNTQVTFYPIEPYIETEYDTFRKITIIETLDKLVDDYVIYSDDNATIMLSDVLELNVKTSTTGNFSRTNSPIAPSLSNVVDTKTMIPDNTSVNVIHTTFTALKPLKISYQMTGWSEKVSEYINSGNPSRGTSKDENNFYEYTQQRGKTSYNMYVTKRVKNMPAISDGYYYPTINRLYCINKYPLSESSKCIRSSLASSTQMNVGYSEAFAIRSFYTVAHTNNAYSYSRNPGTSTANVYDYHLTSDDKAGYIGTYDRKLSFKTLAGLCKFTISLTIDLKDFINT